MSRRQGIAILLTAVVGVLALSFYVRQRDPGYRVWSSLSPVRTDWTVSEVEEIVKKSPLRMVSVPAGKFEMRSLPDSQNGGTSQLVIMGRPFFIGVTEVTQAQYLAVVNDNPSGLKGDRLPVVGISWWQAYRFCRELTMHERNNGSLPEGLEYRLPTEAEWEYCCRAGVFQLPPAARDNNLDASAWYRDNSDGQLHPVGEKRSNAWGLYDMLGNASEYCQDFYGDYPPTTSDHPKLLTVTRVQCRVSRGGSYLTAEDDCGPSKRAMAESETGSQLVGFRVVLDVVRPRPVPKKLEITEFVPIAPGSFSMGSDRGTAAEKPVHRVTITQAFYICAAKVTQAQYSALMGPKEQLYPGEDNPANIVSWDEATDFCRELTATTRKRVVLPEGMEFRLPTEAEWEYCCRAGSTTDYFFGNDPRFLKNYAWYDRNSGQAMHPVASKEPNPWGLYDVYGDVDELCWDWYAAGYLSENQVDPSGPEAGLYHVSRGSSIIDWESTCTSFRRSTAGGIYTGFRIVLGPILEGKGTR